MSSHANEETPLLFKSQLTASLTLSDRSLTEELTDRSNNDDDASFYYNNPPNDKKHEKTPAHLMGVLILVALIALGGYWSEMHHVYRHHSTPKRPVVVPGDAAWLGQGEIMDDAPVDFEAYLPLTYVLMGGPSPQNSSEATAIPRVILLPSQRCPQLILASNATTSLGGAIPRVTLRGVGDMELPHAFPIKLCETKLETRAQKEAWNRGILVLEGHQGKPIVQIPTNPRQVLLMGDTGLRSKATDLGLGSDCDGPKLYGIPQCNRNFRQDNLHQATGSFQSLEDWPLPELMKAAAATQPDLVVNMGDFLYRQSPCPANNTVHADCAAINLPSNFANTLETNGQLVNFVPGHWGDNWFGWWADFFHPALPLLQAAPLVAVRGNHENCERAGYGFFFLLSTLDFPTKSHTGGNWCLDYVPPFAVPFEKEQYLVVDDSIIEPENGGIDDFNFTKGACPGAPQDGSLLVPEPANRWEDPSQSAPDIVPQLALFKRYMQDVKALSMSHETNFYLGHRPFFAVACDGDKMRTMDWTMQQSLEADTLDRVNAMFAGHMHWLEILSFVNQTLPAQVVVGHGGTQRIPNYVDPTVFNSLQLQVGPTQSNGQPLVTARVKEGLTDSRMYGFGIMRRDEETEDYKVQFLSLNRTVTQANENFREVVELDIHLNIPKGPRMP